MVRMFYVLTELLYISICWSFIYTPNISWLYIYTIAVLGYIYTIAYKPINFLSVKNTE